VLVAGIGVKQQGYVAIGGGQDGQPQQSQVVVALFGMTALRQLGPLVEAVQRGEKIGGVKEQTIQIEAEAGNGILGQFLFEGSDLIAAELLHVVPESLTGELTGSQRQRACQHRLLIPGADLRFALRRDTTVQGSQRKILPDRRSLVTAFGDVAIHGSDNIHSLGNGVGCGRAAKFPYRDFVDLGTEEALLDALCETEIDGAKILGLPFTRWDSRW
jgi:hypothetical protein